MSRKTTKSILSRDEISLLINSEETKNIELYGNLYSILSNLQNIKAVTLEQLTSIDTKAKAALTYNKKTLIDTTIKEWYAESVSEEDPTKKVRCGLCNTPNKYLYYIKNRKNNIVLNVGSRCITKFPGIEGYIEQKKQLAQIHKGHKIVQRRNEFYSHFPNYEDFISDAEKYFSTLPILLPHELYENLQNTIERMRLIATKYINEGKKPYESQYDSFELFSLAVGQYNKLKLQADTFVSLNQNSHLICKRREINWLLDNNKNNLLRQISENDGKYELCTLQKMYCTDFIKDSIHLFIERNRSNILKIEKMNDGNFIFSFIKFGYQPSIIFTVNFSDFMKGIGANCIIEEKYSYSSADILSISNILKNKSNLVSILGYIDNMLYTLNYAFLFNEDDNSLYLYRKGDRAVRQFQIDAFMQNYSKYILLSDNEIKKYLIQIIGKNKKWITYEIQEKQGINDKIGILYKEYKESHEYNTHTISKRGFELMVYSAFSNTSSNIASIDFDSPEYIVLHRDQLNINNRQLNFVDYGIRILDDGVSTFYKKNDLLLIQNIQTVKNKTIIFFSYNGGFEIKNCNTLSDEPENIFNFISIPKKEVIAYGKIVYYLRNESLIKSNIIDKNLKNTSGIVKIFVIDHPKQCPKCLKKCIYRHAEYLQENKKLRKIQVAICPECNKYYIDRNSYITYIKSKKETNLEFILPDK